MAAVDHSDLLRRLGEQAESLRSSQGWQDWLRTAQKFRTYSLNNQLLVASQCPQATRVAGYQAWRELGRQVRRGERGIRIFTPVLKSTTTTDDVSGEEVRLQSLAAFRLVSVFDISQTDGRELPELEMPEVELTDERLLSRLEIVARLEGIDLVMVGESASGARGWWDPTVRRITLVEGYSTASRTRTLLHELAHAFDPGCEGFNGRDRDERELVAESAAYLVGAGVGLDLGAASTFYAASWGADTKRLQELAMQVLAVANRLEEALGAVMVPEVAA